jgi:hypothetical protein
MQALAPGEVRGPGRRPAAFQLTLRPAGELQITVAGEDADRLVGPFLTAGLSDPTEAPRERGG